MNRNARCDGASVTDWPVAFLPLGARSASAFLLIAAVSCHASDAFRPQSSHQQLFSSVQENTRDGDPSWYLPPARLAPSAQLAIWAEPYAVASDDTLTLHVNATLGPVRAVVYRLGWYAGAGARRVWESGAIPGTVQPSCSAPVPGPVVCGWSVTARVPVTPDWSSGLYLTIVTDTSGLSAVYPFVVRSDSYADFTVVVPQLTWQAYNAYGGSDFYTSPAGADPAHSVSFRRPYSLYIEDLIYGNWVSHDVATLRFLERNNYSVRYVSDADLDGAAPYLRTPGKGLLFGGHTEYLSWSALDNVQRLRDAGTHLFFFAANNAYWNVRLSRGRDGDHPGDIVTCFKSAADPNATSRTQVTARFRDPPLNRPENGLYGVMFTEESTPGALYPLVARDSNLGPEGAAFLREAGISAGDSLPGLIGDEGDQVFPNAVAPADLQVLFASAFVPRRSSTLSHIYNTTFFRAKSGAGVFASGTNEFGRGLDALHGTPNAKIQRLTAAVLNWMRAN